MSTPKGGDVIKLTTPLSRSVAIVALGAIVLGILGAAIYLPADNVFEQRIGLITMIVAVAVPVLASAVRGDKAATVSESTKADTGKLVNGELQARIEETMHAVLTAHDQDVHGIVPTATRASVHRIVDHERGQTAHAEGTPHT